ncbi:exosortase-dependent surface protein XDP1 [Alishewanella sp. HL-SH06]|uniref:exosortase-dependent surface protein XDP1 n=1 Tax=Alishewanella sp. HL-SH06 TaxID=3461144 RepID=UPI004041C236
MLSAIKKITFGVLCSAALLSTSVLASTTTSTTETWSFTPATTKSVTGANKITLTSASGANAFISGWSSESSDSASNIISAHKLILDSKYGVQIYGTNSDESHTVDNKKGLDFIFLEFPSPVELLSLTNTWVTEGMDSDISIATFNSNPFTNISSPTLNFTQLASAAIVKASYANTGINTPYIFESSSRTESYSTQNIKGVSSQYWLIGAYNAAFDSGSCKLSCLNDAMKFGSITAKLAALPTSPDNAQDVPLPGTLSLFAAGIFGLMYRNRRRTQR